MPLSYDEPKVKSLPRALVPKEDMVVAIDDTAPRIAENQGNLINIASTIWEFDSTSLK
jgi:hypothetical protein